MIRTLFAALTMAIISLTAQAQSIIRDAEIEHALDQLAAPILSAAGLPGSTRIIVIDDDRMNAFVANSRYIFINSGLILRTEDAAMLQAVIAHEAAHIANGHLTRRATAARGASNIARIGLLIGIAAAAGGNADLGLGVAAGSSATATNALFAHTRAEEASADQSGLRYMARAGVDPLAAKRVLDLFRGQEALSVGRQDPYARTHPLTRDRIRAVEAYAQGVRVTPRDQSRAEYWYGRAKGKLSAFLRAPSWTLRRVRGQNDGVSIMRAAVAEHRKSNTRRALQLMDSLLAAAPNDPYWHELKGQILLESRNAGASVASYRRAAQLAPREPLIKAGLGRALVATGQYAAARDVLTQARGSDPFNPSLLRDLAQAHARLGEGGLASVATAERYAVLGRIADAKIHAERASGILPRGSAGWLRAQDILAVR